MAIREQLFLRQIRYVRPDLGDQRTAEVRRQIVRDFGALLPPFALHLPVPEALCAYWAITREPTCGQRVDRAPKEAVAAAVSASNTCPYCVDVHTTMLHALGDRSSAAKIAAGQTEAIADRALHDVVAWARQSRQPEAAVVRSRPFPDEHAPELIGIAVAYHYINRMVNVFVEESPFPLPGVTPKPIALRMALPVFRRIAARRVLPGESLGLLPAAPLPDDLGWAESDPIIAGAFARAAAAFDRIGERALPAEIRDLIASRLNEWRGEEPGLSRRWVEDAVDNLTTAQRQLGRFALLTALASYQVDSKILEDARPSGGPVGDEVLVAAAAWASFSAARRIGSWLHTGAVSTGREPGVAR